MGEDIGNPLNVQIITTPTFDWLAEQARACSSHLLISSPFVNDGILKLTDLVPKEASRTLVTRTDLRDFAVGASNLDTLCSLSRDGVSIRSLSRLHAKIYVFDSSVALVTSANATRAGLWRNFECGLGITDTATVRELAKSLLNGFGTKEEVDEIGLKELLGMYRHLESIKVTFPPHPKRGDHAAPGPEPTFSISDKEVLLKGFTGWLRLTLEGVLKMPEAGFQMDELLQVCGPEASRKYPKNRFVPEKLRQQLQVLRNRGLVEFVSPGIYRRTMSAVNPSPCTP